MALVFIPALLRPLSGGRATVETAGATVREVIANLERVCPGIGERLLDGARLRSNVQVAVDGVVSPMGLRAPVGEQSEVHFVAAISGGRCGPVSPTPLPARPCG